MKVNRKDGQFVVYRPCGSSNEEDGILSFFLEVSLPI